MTRQRPSKIRRLSGNKPSEAQNQEGKATRILYVEDAEVIRDTIARLLELKGGYEVMHARNGQEGVEKAVKWGPDLVLMDLRMPVMNGYEAISHIKENPKTKHLPVFVLSAWSGKQERSQAKMAGADEYFVKPPDLDQLVEAINSAVAATKQ